MAALTITNGMVEGRFHIKLAGRIDETADFTAAQTGAHKAVIFDFSGVTLINSLGIQAWGKFMKALPVGVKIGFHRCPLRIVNQINLFPGFLGGRSVVFISFFAPYRCDPCNSTESVLLKAKDCRAGEIHAAPLRTCGKCKKQMEFAAIEEKYFMFLDRSKSA